MTPPSSKYGPLHALAAGAVLVYAVLSNGFAAFWQQFLHGLNIQLDEKTLLPMLGVQSLFFGGLFLILWASTLFQKRNQDNEHRGGGRLARNWDNGHPARCVRLTLLSALPICLIALGLNWACGELLSRLAGVDLSDQDLVKFLTSNSLSLRGKAIFFAFLLVDAPIVEELLFRGVIFGGLTKIMPVWGAILLSGFIFAVIHVNAATLIPLWFLGVAFAWLYVHTGTLLAPMAVHFSFNAINLVLCPFV